MLNKLNRVKLVNFVHTFFLRGKGWLDRLNSSVCDSDSETTVLIIWVTCQRFTSKGLPAKVYLQETLRLFRYLQCWKNHATRMAFQMTQTIILHSIYLVVWLESFAVHGQSHLTEADKQELLNAINHCRSSVSPIAANMQRLVCENWSMHACQIFNALRIYVCFDARVPNSHIDLLLPSECFL